MPRPPSVLALVAMALASTARADRIWYEVTDGDLSNDPLHPTPLTLHPGINSVLAAANGTDDPRDWMAITVPAGYQLSTLVLGDYDSFDLVAFTGVQAGPQFLGDPTLAASYLGYSHFGPELIGTDLLPLMGDPVNAPGSEGFTPPLPSGVYTFLVQQLGEDTLYQFDFELTQAPAPPAVMVLAAGVLAVSRRRRR